MSGTEPNAKPSLRYRGFNRFMNFLVVAILATSLVWAFLQAEGWSTPIGTPALIGAWVITAIVFWWTKSHVMNDIEERGRNAVSRATSSLEEQLLVAKDRLTPLVVSISAVKTVGKVGQLVCLKAKEPHVTRRQLHAWAMQNGDFSTDIWGRSDRIQALEAFGGEGRAELPESLEFGRYPQALILLGGVLTDKRTDPSEEMSTEVGLIFRNEGERLPEPVEIPVRDLDKQRGPDEDEEDVEPGDGPEASTN